VPALPPDIRRIASSLIGVRNLLKKVLALSLRNGFQKRPLFSLLPAAKAMPQSAAFSIRSMHSLEKKSGLFLSLRMAVSIARSSLKELPKGPERFSIVIHSPLWGQEVSAILQTSYSP